MTWRPLIGVSASLHDFGDYGGVGVQRPLYDAGAPLGPGAGPRRDDVVEGRLGPAVLQRAAA